MGTHHRRVYTPAFTSTFYCGKSEGCQQASLAYLLHPNLLTLMSSDSLYQHFYLCHLFTFTAKNSDLLSHDSYKPITSCALLLWLSIPINSCKNSTRGVTATRAPYDRHTTLFSRWLHDFIKECKFVLSTQRHNKRLFRSLLHRTIIQIFDCASRQTDKQIKPHNTLRRDCQAKTMGLPRRLRGTKNALVNDNQDEWGKALKAPTVLETKKGLINHSAQCV